MWYSTTADLLMTYYGSTDSCEDGELDTSSLGNFLTAAVLLMGPFLGSSIRWLSGKLERQIKTNCYKQSM